MGRIRSEIVNRLIWGLFLIALGALLLAVNLGMEVPKGIWNYWPFLLIVFGVAKLLFGGGDGGGFWLVLAGLYGWISIWNVWGLTWGTAWPIFVIAGGISVVLEPALAQRRGGRGGAAAEGQERADHVG